MRDIAVVLITIDRTPNTNFLGETLTNLARSRVQESKRLHSFHIVDSGSPDPRAFVKGCLPSVISAALYSGDKRTPTENAAAALHIGGSTDAAWVLFLEDDIDVCDRFLDSVGAWLDRYAESNVPLYAFGAAYDQIRGLAKRGHHRWVYQVKDFYGTTAIAVRREDALSIAEWLFERRDKKEYDLHIAKWAEERGVGHFLASVPSFVQHLGSESGIRPGTTHITYTSWPGRQWSFAPRQSRRPDQGRRRLLWVGDAGVPSGFAKATHAVCDYLDYRANPTDGQWDVTILGINYRGDPHDYAYPIWSALPGGDLFGIGRMAFMCDVVKPDVIVIQQDPWNFPPYLKELSKIDEYRDIPVVGFVAVDGLNCRGMDLNGLAMAVFWTEFGREQAKQGGYNGPSTVVPLGVDTDLYTPDAQDAARLRLKLPALFQNAYIVGNVNRNQPRKRLDLTIRYFAEWVKQHHVDDAYLYLHVAPTGEYSYNVQQLAKYYGVLDRLILLEPPSWYGIPELAVVDTYRSFDVQISTTQGEGFGLTTFEGMACGVPQIVPDWSALGELCQDAALLIPCTTTSATIGRYNAIGGVADEAKFVEALDRVYRDKLLRRSLHERGLALVRQSKFRWEHIGRAMGEVLDPIYTRLLLEEVEPQEVTA